MKYRFSLRTGLIVVAIVSSAIYWRTRPSTIANDFETAINTYQYERADAMVEKIMGGPKFAAWFQKSERLEVKTEFDNPTVADWFLGRRQGSYTVSAKFDRYAIGQEGTLTATATGVTVFASREARNDLSGVGNLISDWLPTGLK